LTTARSTALFRVGVTPDAYAADGTPLFDFSELDAQPGIERELLEMEIGEVPRELLEDLDALILPTAMNRLPAASLAHADRLTLVARLAVGYDRIDVDACNEQGIFLTVAPDTVRRPMASAAIAYLLALTLKLPQKDRVIRERRWDDHFGYTGVGLVGKTLGVVGVGNIGLEVLRLAEPFSMGHLAFDPYVDRERLPKRLRVELVDLDTLLAQSDAVVLTLPLTQQTRGLIDGPRLGLLKPSAYLINIARGPIVDQAALTRALAERRIAGAALDVFEQEPLADDDPLIDLDNVILTPHAIGRTEEWFVNGARAAANAVGAVAHGRRPPHVVNPAVLRNPRLEEKLRRHRRRSRALVAPSR
jgi:D-3-phosphoglycerate dehydrogenase